MRWHKAVWADREQAVWKHAWRNARATIHPVDVLARLLLVVPVSTAVICARNLADKLAKADSNLARFSKQIQCCPAGQFERAGNRNGCRAANESGTGERGC